MFEDLIKPTEVLIENQAERCPYCGTYEITGDERIATLDDKWEQKIRCDLCLKIWTLVYNEDQTPSHILLDEYRKKKK